ncbi:hypothetical protein AB8D53_27155 [Salmonella enterica]
MKRINTSLKKTGIIFSLVLLSPGVMAAENLNFNYTRAGALSLDPRLGVQAQACHSKGDPLVLNFRVSDILVSLVDYGHPYPNFPGLQIRLKVRGAAYEKSYAIFSVPGSSGKVKAAVRNTDTDFLIPWSVSASGIVSGTNGSIEGLYGDPEQVSYGDPFCFTDSPGFQTTGNVNTYHYVPIYRNSPRAVGGDKSLFQRYCHEFLGNVTEEDGGGQYYWPSSNQNPAYPGRAPDYIQRKIDAEKSDPDYNSLYMPHPYLVKTLFFRTKYVIPAKPVNPHFSSEGRPFHDVPVAKLETMSNSPDTYLLPLSNEYHWSTILDNANVAVTFGNRNISSLSLILIQYDGKKQKSYTLEWVRDSANSNVLHYQGKGDLNNLKGGDNDSSTDPYAAHQFYPPNTSGFFKGTLVNGGALTQAYRDYVDNIMPLSLPPDVTGDINLVNTDSLNITIARGNMQANIVDMGNTTYNLTVTGQPLKFAPLRVNGKEVASAMQMRNACY